MVEVCVVVWVVVGVSKSMDSPSSSSKGEYSSMIALLRVFSLEENVPTWPKKTRAHNTTNKQTKKFNKKSSQKL